MLIALVKAFSFKCVSRIIKSTHLELGRGLIKLGVNLTGRNIVKRAKYNPRQSIAFITFPLDFPFVDRRDEIDEFTL